MLSNGSTCLHSGQDSEKDYGWWYSILLSVWIMTGLSWAATMIANLQELYQSMMYPEDVFEDVEEEKPPETETVNTKVEEGLLEEGSSE